MSDSANLGLLNKATISYEYLHSNSTTHDYLLGAIAELVDNSRDARAKNLKIDFDREEEYLSLLDDGCGMTKRETETVLSFGFSNKRNMEGMIGQYGNGLKSGAMRIANDMILLTKKDGQFTCLLLSRTFHKEHNLGDVLVPSPTFNAEDRHMMCRSDEEIKKHRLEMELIYKYSPFHGQDQLFAQFDKIAGESGTLIVLYNLRRLLSGDLELDLKSSEDDIRLADSEEHREDEYNSLRSYLSVLYLEPRMKIYLRGKKIQLTRLTSNLLMKYKYTHLGKNLKACAKKEHEACLVALKAAQDRLLVAESDFGRHANLEIPISDKNGRLERRNLGLAVDREKQAVKECKEREVKAKKAISNPQALEIVFGLNIHHRNRYGCMFYNNGRLILAYQKGYAQTEKNDLMMQCLGVVGIVDVPYSVLAPTHNKQKFENQREFLGLLKAVNDLMLKYWKAILIGDSPSGIKHFWKKFGYNNADWTAQPQADKDGKSARYEALGFCIQCDKCLKWRQIKMQMKYMNYGVPDEWTCADNPNSMHRSCNQVEEFEKIRCGVGIVEKQIEAVIPAAKKSIKPEIDLPRAAEKRKTSENLVSSTSSARKPARNYREESEEEDSEEEEEPAPKKSARKIEKPPARPSTSAATSAQKKTPARKSVVLESSDEEEFEEPPRPSSKRSAPPKPSAPSAISSSSSSSTRSGRVSVPVVKKTTAIAKPPPPVVQAQRNGTSTRKPVSSEPPLEISERLELTKKTDALKKSNALIRDFLKQLAKKGANDADKALRLSDEKLRETLDPERLVEDFWKEKHVEPMRKVREQGLSEKRGLVSPVVEQVEVLPEKHKKLLNSSITILQWLVEHYHQDLKLPDTFVVDEQSVFEVAEKMCEVVMVPPPEEDSEGVVEENGDISI
ncbi:unnamed protein product [Caenorhabditis angaria]|uniref:CW-type domain-containing protein n=1 Tax=Caenorhabditis angaria TaxID=860376 RepID=A0A9P1IKG1_9PELO|nr:unnamed protein product [Caenorhabditis angaria]